MALRVIVMGSARLTMPTLTGLLDSRHEVVAAVTQPDRMGRGHHNRRNPIAVAAEERGCVVFQPENINTDESVERLQSFEADIAVVAAYGQLLSQRVLDVPRLDTINVHASLLPRHRGATPIQAAILAGDAETGVSIMRIVRKLDAGPVFRSRATAIDPHETAGDLEERLSHLAVPLLLEVLDEFEASASEAGSALPEPVGQDESLVTYAPRMSKADGRIDWTQSQEQVLRHIRAMQPWPSAFTWLLRAGQKPLRITILRAEAVEVPTGEPGDVISEDPHSLTVRTGEAGVRILELQPEGKRAMEAAAFLNGYRPSAGDRLGDSASA